MKICLWGFLLEDGVGYKMSKEFKEFVGADPILVSREATITDLLRRVKGLEKVVLSAKLNVICDDCELA